MKYPKIQTIYKRNMDKGPDKGKLLEGQWTLPEFEMLKGAAWHATEKVDGTNIRVCWDSNEKRVTVKGRTDNAQLAPGLVVRIQELFPAEKFVDMPDCILFGEGVGGKIQGNSKEYCIDTEYDFIGFDVRIANWWLEQDAVDGIFNKFGARVAPYFGTMSLHIAVLMVQSDPPSFLGDRQSEGLVLRAPCGLLRRNGERLICKIKVRDFND